MLRLKSGKISLYLMTYRSKETLRNVPRSILHDKNGNPCVFLDESFPPRKLCLQDGSMMEIVLAELIALLSKAKIHRCLRFSEYMLFSLFGSSYRKPV